MSQPCYDEDPNNYDLRPHKKNAILFAFKCQTNAKATQQYIDRNRHYFDDRENPVLSNHTCRRRTVW